MDSPRAQFPIFRQKEQNPLHYLDSAATAQKPQSVIDAVVHYYSDECSNIHRGVHRLSEQATASYEKSRAAMCRFIGAQNKNEIVFTGGATEGINLVAQTYGKTRLRPGDEIVISAMEHHSNIVPWQMLCEEKEALLRVIPVDESGDLSPGAFEAILGPKTRLVALTHISNVLGTVNPVRDMIRTAHDGNIPVLIDGAQSAGRIPVDVAELDCDFFVLSGHKAYGPTGIGILYGKGDLLESMPPYRGGGDMIRSVSFDKTVYRRPPYKFEAGTPNIAGAIGLGAAVDFMESVGIENIMEHERRLTVLATRVLREVEGLRILGSPADRAGVLSFVMEGIHPHDIAAILDRKGIAIRAGHHCAQPLIEFFGVPATARISFGVYNTAEDLEALIHGLETVKRVFQK